MMENMKIGARLAVLFVIQLAFLALIVFTDMEGTVLYAVSAAGQILLLLLFTAAGRSVARPLAKITAVIKDMAKGTLRELPRVNGDSETGQLEASVAALSVLLSKWKSDIADLAKKHAAGDVDAVLDEKAFEGGFRETARDINATLQMYGKDISGLAECIGKYGQGDFRAQYALLPGKKNRLNQAMDSLRDNVRTVMNDLQTISASYAEGKFNAGTGGKFGDWSLVYRDINAIAEAISKPIKEASDALSHVAAGDLKQHTPKELKGEFALLTQGINKAAENMSGYVKDIAAVLTEMSASNPQQRARREYAGPFPAVRDAFKALDGRISQLEKQAGVSAPVKPAVSTVTRLAPPPKAAPQTTAAKPAAGAAAPKAAPVEGRFNPAMPTIPKRTLAAPNASHIYDSKDFGKYK
jgi:methyl-accepting chemotaxis protein